MIRDIAWKAQARLCARYRRLAAIGKPKVVVTTAIAREWSASSGRSPALHSLSSSDQPLTEPTKRRQIKIEVRIAGDRTAVGILCACYEPVSGSMLDPRARQPRRNDGHAVPNPRMRACSTGVFGSCLLLCASMTHATRQAERKTARYPLTANMRTVCLSTGPCAGIPCVYRKLGADVLVMKSGGIQHTTTAPDYLSLAKDLPAPDPSMSLGVFFHCRILGGFNHHYVRI